MKLLHFSLVLMIALCYTGMAHASKGKKIPGDSVIQGSIINSITKKPVGEVTVSLSLASGKQQAKKELKSDASGFFIFPQMPPGEFTLQVEKKGYKTYRKNYVMIKEGMQLKLALEEEDEDVDTWNPLRMLYGK